MSRRKTRPEEKIRIVRSCLSGKISQREASRQSGVNQKTLEEWISQYKAGGMESFYPEERNRQYAPELKEEAVRAYLAGEGSLRKICKRFKIRNKSQLISWIKMYNGHKDFKKEKGRTHMTKGRKTTKEERIAIARECLEADRNYGEIAAKHHVSYQQVYQWTNKYAELGDKGLEDRRGKRIAKQEPRTPEEELRIRIAQLEHELYMTRMERDLLKKLDEIERRRG